MTTHSIQNSSGSATGSAATQQRLRTPLIALAVVLGAVVVFGAAYLIAHKSQPPAPAAHVVNARIAPGPSAGTLKHEFSVQMGALIKPKPKPKPHKKAATSTVASYTPPAQTYTPPAQNYTPPASSSSSKPKGSGAPSGGGVITIG